MVISHTLCSCLVRLLYDGRMFQVAAKKCDACQLPAHIPRAPPDIVHKISAIRPWPKLVASRLEVPGKEESTHRHGTYRHDTSYLVKHTPDSRETTIEWHGASLHISLSKPERLFLCQPIWKELLVLPPAQGLPRTAMSVLHTRCSSQEGQGGLSSCVANMTMA